MKLDGYPLKPERERRERHDGRKNTCKKKAPERKQRKKHGIVIGRGRAGDLRSGRGAVGARTDQIT